MNRQIKKTFVFVALLAVCAFARADQSVSLAWDSSTGPDVMGYALYFGTNSGNYPTRIDVGTNTVATITGLQQGLTYYFVVTAYNADRIEGLPSNEANFSAPTVVPGTPQFSAVSPGSGPVGTPVTVNGQHFTSATSVKFNGVPATFTVLSDSLLTAIVPPGAATGPLTVTTSYGTIAARFTVISASAPANDNFASAQVLTGPAAQVYASNRGATEQAGEPNHSGNSGGASIWYRWTAPVSGIYTLDASGSDFPVLLAVYSGSSLNSLAPAANNNAGNGTFNTTTTFNATAGVTYQIAVDGVNGATGNAVLRLLPPASFASTIYSTTFENANGYILGLPLGAEDGWVTLGTGAAGIINNIFSGQGQQGYIGLASVLPGSTLAAYRPLNFSLGANVAPTVQFTVWMQINNYLNLGNDAFAWTVRNAAGHELFTICFDNQNKLISYALDNNAGLVLTSHTFTDATLYGLVVTMDFAHNTWSASLSGVDLVGQKPITTTGAPLTLGDIMAKANFKDLLHAGLDGMVFDNYSVTASFNSSPAILFSPQSQTVIAGNNVLLSVAATGNTPLSYQWYRNNVALSGATSATLALSGVSSAQAGNYYVMVSNGSGSATSATANISVSTPAFARPLLTAPVVATGNGVQINLSVAPNTTYRLQASTNLTTWTTLGSYYSSGTNLMCFDPAATNYRQRFYRVVTP